MDDQQRNILVQYWYQNMIVDEVDQSLLHLQYQKEPKRPVNKTKWIPSMHKNNVKLMQKSDNHTILIRNTIFYA